MPSGGKLHCRGRHRRDRREALSGLSVPAEEIEQPPSRTRWTRASPRRRSSLPSVRWPWCASTRSLATHGGFATGRARDAETPRRRGRRRDGERQPPRRERARRRRDLARARARDGDEPRDRIDARSRSRHAVRREPRDEGAAVRPRRHRALRAGRLRHPRGRRRRDGRPEDPELQDLAVRAAWAAGIGQSLLPLRSHRAGVGRRATVPPDLQRRPRAPTARRAGCTSRSRTTEGVVGILVFESARPDFATPRAAELAAILANQATVAAAERAALPPGPARRALGALQRAEAGVLRAPAAAPPHLRSAPRRGPRVAHAHSLADAGRPASTRSFRPTARAEIRPMTAGHRSSACSCARAASSSVERRSCSSATPSSVPSARRRSPRSAASRARGGRRGIARGRGRGAAPAHARRRAAPRSRPCSTSSSASSDRARARAAASCSPRGPRSASDRMGGRGRSRWSSSVAPTRWSWSSASISATSTRVQARGRGAAARRRVPAAHVRRAACTSIGATSHGQRREPCRSPCAPSCLTQTARCGRAWRRTRACSPRPLRCSAARLREPVRATRLRLVENVVMTNNWNYRSRAPPSPSSARSPRRAAARRDRRRRSRPAAGGRRDYRRSSRRHGDRDGPARAALAALRRARCGRRRAVGRHHRSVLDAELGARVSGGALLARLESTDQGIALAGATPRTRDTRTALVNRARAMTKAGGVTVADSEQVEFQLRAGGHRASQGAARRRAHPHRRAVRRRRHGAAMRARGAS